MSNDPLLQLELEEDKMLVDDPLYDRIEDALHGLREELHKAMTKHAPMHSAHEGHSVIREELDELWEHVRADTGHTPAARKEALQVAAMGLRYALDVAPPVVHIEAK